MIVEPESRELTRRERREIKRLVVEMCANYDRDYGCLPLDYGRCYMLDKWWTGSYCKYFRNAVLPFNPALEVALTGSGSAGNMKPCAVCGKPFIPAGRQAYCSDSCRVQGTREKEREKKRNQRKNKR